MSLFLLACSQLILRSNQQQIDLDDTNGLIAEIDLDDDFDIEWGGEIIIP